MELSDALHLFYLILLLGVFLALRKWPGLQHRKFDWRLFKDARRKKD